MQSIMKQLLHDFGFCDIPNYERRGDRKLPVDVSVIKNLIQ